MRPLVRLLFINPNATESMTGTIAEAARRAAPEGVEILARTNHAGPPAIQGEAHSSRRPSLRFTPSAISVQSAPERR